MRCPTPPLVALLAALGAWPFVSAAQSSASADKFRPLDDLLPPPTAQRTASGAPGPGYWQQRVDYEIAAELDEPNRRITGSAKVTYHNASPDPLTFLWLQLDRNLLARDSLGARATINASEPANLRGRELDTAVERTHVEGGYANLRVTDLAGRALPQSVFDTLLRIDLPDALPPGGTFTFHTAWEFPINPTRGPGSVRGGFETFGDDRAGAHAVYAIALWYPRLAAYTDYAGWQTKPFLGDGEFALEFGDFEVRLTVPDDHVVAATGALKNPGDVLTRPQHERLKQAGESRTPVFIVTPDEARAAEDKTPSGRKTWIFAAENVRDFAFASSRAFIWDAMGVPGQTHRNRPVLAMSFYPKEGQPLWDKFATHAIAHSLEVFSRHTFPYPYPVAISVLGGVPLGMEFPMINFNGRRPDPDGSYEKYIKDTMIGCVVHETGHNFFPMIVNSDERLWAWQDEGLTTFLEDIAMRQWEPDPRFARRRLDEIIPRLRGSDRPPVMTVADSLGDLATIGYDLPTAALQVLRETVLGRERFDFALRAYAQRWMFRRATPADFFRTMEDASGTDLDWFWRAWFFSSEHVDLAIDRVTAVRVDPTDALAVKLLWHAARDARPTTTADDLDGPLPKRTGEYPELLDEHSTVDELALSPRERARYERLLAHPPAPPPAPAHHFTLVAFSNRGGIVMPLPLRIEYTDGTTEDRTLPVELWRVNPARVSKLLVTPKAIAAVTLDPREELTDVNPGDNRWPRRIEAVRIEARASSIEAMSLSEVLAALRESSSENPPAPAPSEVTP